MSDLPKLSEIRQHVAWGSRGPLFNGLVAAVDAVLALHREERGWCRDCSNERDAEDYPCATVRALAERIDLEG